MVQMKQQSLQTAHTFHGGMNEWIKVDAVRAVRHLDVTQHVAVLAINKSLPTLRGKRFGALHQRRHQVLIQAANGNFIFGPNRLPATAISPSFFLRIQQAADALPGIYRKTGLPQHRKQGTVFFQLGQQVESPPFPCLAGQGIQ